MLEAALSQAIPREIADLERQRGSIGDFDGAVEKQLRDLERIIFLAGEYGLFERRGRDSVVADTTTVPFQHTAGFRLRLDSVGSKSGPAEGNEG